MLSAESVNGCVETGRRSFYDRHIAPHFVHSGCSMGTFARRRERVVPRAEGVGVEAGFGSGLNLGFYDAGKVRRLIAVDPDPAMLRIADASVKEDALAAAN